MATEIFICYRRDDSAGYTGRIEDRIRGDLGDVLFVDVDAVPLGVNFVKFLRQEVARCAVLLAVIGDRWLDARDEDGKRRLDNPNDFVRVEIGAALQRDIPVIPILLDGVKIPRANQLPNDLEELAVRNGLDVRHTSFHTDMDKLIRELKGHLAQPEKQNERTREEALDGSKRRPSVFLSFAPEDVEWKRTLMQPSWWAALTKVAEVLDYDAVGDVYNSIKNKAIRQSSAFIVILSRYYIQKDRVVEGEFRSAADRFCDPDQRNFFRPIVIDPEAKQWWDGRRNKIFEQYEWLQNQIYWELIEQNRPALLTGDLQAHYARDVREYAEKLAASITASQRSEPSAL
jgi:TIR domain-containing protein